MAKDRTRHARIREPKQESQADVIALETARMFEIISEYVAAALSGFSDWAAETTDCIKRLLEAPNGER